MKCLKQSSIAWLGACAAAIGAFGLCNDAAKAVEARRGAPWKIIMEATLGAEGCRALQTIELGGGGNLKLFLALFDCGAVRDVVAITEGRYPIPASADPKSYRIVAKRDVTTNLEENVSLTASYCRSSKHELPHGFLVRTTNHTGNIVTAGHGLLEIVVFDSSNQQLKSLPLDGIKCSDGAP